MVSSNGGPKLITYPVTQCTGYESKKLPSIYEMKRTAWIITPDRTGKIGFIPASKIEPHSDEWRRAGLDDIG